MIRPPLLVLALVAVATTTSAFGEERVARGKCKYINVDGELVLCPEESGSPQKPSGMCRDGNYTYARHKTGACSRHGGLKEWYGADEAIDAPTVQGPDAKDNSDYRRRTEQPPKR